MNYTINPLTEHATGAEILGLDLKAPLDAELRKALNAEFAKYHVLVFRGQQLAAPDFAHAGEIFGEIMSQHHKDIRATGHPEVFEIRNEKIAPGKYRIAGETFHTDHSNHPVRIESIVGMPDDDAMALVNELMAHATQQKYEYRHKWHYGDMVIWDNRSVMHQANGDYDMNETRHLYRLMVVGEPVLAAALAGVAA